MQSSELSLVVQLREIRDSHNLSQRDTFSVFSSGIGNDALARCYTQKGVDLIHSFSVLLILQITEETNDQDTRRHFVITRSN